MDQTNGVSADSAPDKGEPVANPDEPYIAWIRSGLKRRGPKGERLTQIGMARALGVDHAVVTRLLKGERRLKHWEISKIAAYLGLSPPNILGADEPAQNETAQLASAPVPLNYVSVRGECAGGRWMEYEVGDPTYETVPVVPTKFSTLEQFAFRVRGGSMDKAKILDGDYVICVPYFMARAALTNGDIVVVERRRAGLYERTCKVVEVRPGAGVALASRSSDPRHADPLLIVNGDSHEDETEVEVVGLVIGRYSPI
jgi:SOS-response transcriptional repressor LexA